MLCDVKINSLEYLKKKGVTDDVRKILDREEFDKINDQLTDLARVKYGLDTQGDKLFGVNISEQIDPRTSRYWRDDQYKIYRAIPNDTLFERLDQLYKQRQNTESLDSVNPGTRFFKFDPFIYNQGVPMVDININDLKNARVKEKVEVIAERLAGSMNVKYDNITPEAATELLKNRAVPYRGEPGFYFAGTVYTVGDNVSLSTVMHEFSHPILQGLRKDNLKLFRSLYDQFMATGEGVGVNEYVKQVYPELDVESDLFKEEVLAFGMQLKSVNKITNEPETDGFSSFIKKLLAAIKKTLRNLFGSKVKVSKLDVDTTLDEMADMLIEKDFEFETADVTEEDLVMYARMVSERANELAKGTTDGILQDILEKTYRSNLDILRNAKNFRGDKKTKKIVREALFEKGTSQLLPGVRSSLSAYVDSQELKNLEDDELIENILNSEESRLTDIQNKSVALINSFDTINNMSKNILQDINKISKDKTLSNRHTIGMLALYKNTSRAWMTLLKDIDKEISLESGEFIDTSNPFYSTLNEIANNVTRIQTGIADVLKKNNVQFFVEITSYMNDFVNKKLNSNLGTTLKNAFPDLQEREKVTLEIANKIEQQSLTEEDIKELVDKGAPAQILRELLKEYKDNVVDEEKIKNALTGNAHDVSWFNRWLESYSSSNDVVVGPLAMFIQDQRTEVENEVWKKSMTFRTKLKELLPKVNFSKLNTAQVRELVGEKDTIMFYDKETGEPAEKEIYKFASEFGNGWRYQQDILQYNLAKAKDEGDTNKIAEAQQALQEFNNDYMWQEYVPEYYSRNDIFKQSSAGKLAYSVRKEKLAAFNNLQNQFDNELERVENYGAIKAAWREYQQLSSLEYEDGTPKVDDVENGIYDKSIAEVLIEAKKGTQFREMIPIAGSLQTSYNEFVTLLQSRGITRGNAEFKGKLADWQKQNIKIKYTDEYWDSRNAIITELSELQSQINETTNQEFDVSEAFKKINDYIYSYRDEFNQPIANEMGETRLREIKNLQQQIIDTQSLFDKRTGLRKDQSDELFKLTKDAKEGKLEPGSAKMDRYKYLIGLQEATGISAQDSARVKELLSQLFDLTEVQYTDYYMDAINYSLSKQNLKEIDVDEVKDFINSDEFQEILDNDQVFRDWFVLNHVERERWNNTTKELEIEFVPTKANTISVPKDPSHYESTTVTDIETGQDVILPGVPSSRHSRFEVKNEYRTIPYGESREDYVGRYVDNKGNFLPRKFDPSSQYSAKDDRFMSQKYKELSSNPSSPVFQLLETMTEYHLDMQKGMTNYGKLYLDMPRYATKRGDYYQAFEKGKYGERFKEVGANIKEWMKQSFTRSAVDFENDYNYDPENNLVNTDLNGDAITYIPVTGIYNLELDITDMDVISGLFKYALSIQTQGKLLESLPLVESVLSTLQDPNNQPKELEKYSKNMQKVRGILQKANKKGATNNRMQQVKSLVEREYYGKQVEGIDETHPMIARTLQTLQGISSYGSLALNIPADLKNQFSGYVQTIIESVGADFITTKDLALATPWATRAMLEWSKNDIYETGPGSLSGQLVQIFDPAFKATDEFGRQVMRSMVKDLTNMEWMFMHRKFGEMDVAMKLFGSFLHGQKITQLLSDGTEKTIRYVDAWEKDGNGIAKLKEGIHPGWNNTSVFHEYVKGESLAEIAKKYHISETELKAKNRIKSEIQLEDGQELVIAKSEKFKAFKNRLQGTSRRLFGVYDRMGQPEGNKLLMYRMFFFMRKWFTPMFTNRFGMDTKTATLRNGGERYDWALGTYNKGYYISAFQTMYKVISTKGADYQYLTKQEKSDFRRFASEGLATIMLALIASMLLGYDPDDEDRWKKMKRRSGAVNESGFDTYGFLANHALLLTLGVQAETTAFIPLPSIGGVNLGADDYIRMVTSTSSAWYNTTTLYAQIMGDILSFVTFNGLPEYKKDVGPYWFQEKGTPKIWKKLFKTVGFTGGSGDPVSVTKNLAASSSRLGQ